MLRHPALRSAFRWWLACALASSPLCADVVVNEIMYNSPGGTDVEYVELYNTGPATQALDGWYLLDDDDLHVPCALSGSLAPGEYLAVAGTVGLFQLIYPAVTNLNPVGCEGSGPETGFSWGNSSDRVRLFDASEALVDLVEYQDGSPWPAEADGDGPSLELLNPALDNTLASSWAAGTTGPPGGTPGAQNSVFVSDPSPQVGDVRRDVALPTAADAVAITAEVTDDQPLASVELWVDTGAGFAAQSMFDDGLHGDDGAGDSVFGATIPAWPTATLVRYYVAATDNLPQTVTFPENAPTDYRAYTVGYVPPRLVINEMVASNQTGITDEAGESADWIEIRNPGPGVIELAGMFLSDDLGDSTRWQIPSSEIPPGDRLLVWCDGDTQQGQLHASFGLAKSGGEIGLFDTVDHGNVLIHGWTYGPQNTDMAFGFRTEGDDAPEYLVPPTPRQNNAGSSPFSDMCINEFLATSNLGAMDAIELYNRGDVSVDLTGWYLSDDARDTMKYAFPSRFVPAGSFVAVDETELGFGLAGNGSEVIVLTLPDGTTGMDYFDYGPQLPDVSRGRFPDGTANWHFFGSWNLGLANDCNQGVWPPGAVSSLRFDARDTLGWDAATGAAAYDVVRASFESPGSLDLTLSSTCLDNNCADTTAWDGSSPPPNYTFVYIVRAVDFNCGFGTWETAESITDDRDTAIQASQNTCP